jgi:hypothetical protein
MKDTRSARVWSLLGVCALAVTAGIASHQTLARRRARVVVADEMRDAVAEPSTPSIARLGGKPVPTTWFKTPDSHRAEMDSALLSSRRRRALAARRVAVQ